MGTDYEREQREARAEANTERLEALDRRAEMAPAPRVIRTPREEVLEHVRLAAKALRCDPFDRVGALMRLDLACEVLDSPSVVDGAALVEQKVQRAVELAHEGEYNGEALEEVLELLRQPVRRPGADIPVHAGDFEPDRGERALKRQAVRSVLKRFELRVSALGLDVQVLTDEAIDEIVAAAETGV